MRAITGAVVSSEPCTLAEAHNFLQDCCSSPDAYLNSSDCATYILTLDDAIVDQHRFFRHLARQVRQQGAEDLDAGGYVVEDDERELQGEEKNRGTLAPLGGPHGSVEDEEEEEEVTSAADEKKSKKRKKEDDTRDDKALVAGDAPHAPASPEIQFEQRKKRKEKHSGEELVSVVKQEPDLVVEEEVGSERKKKKEKHSDKLVLEEELGSEKKKNKKKKEKGHVKLEENLEEANGVADGEKKMKKKKHSEEVDGSKSVKQEGEMATDSNLDSERKKKKKKRGRGDDDDDVQEQGDHKKKQRKES